MIKMGHIDKMDKVNELLRNEIYEISDTSYQLAERIYPKIIHILEKYATRIVDQKFLLFETKEEPVRFFSLVTPITRKIESQNKVKKTNRVFKKLQETIENIKNDKNNLIEEQKDLINKVKCLSSSKVELKKHKNDLDKVKMGLNKIEGWENDPWTIYVNDLARFRIICCYLYDVYLLACDIAERFNDELQQNERSIKDYIFGMQANSRANAAKSIHIRFIGDEKVNIELQLMTLLHFGWDQIEHPHYEKDRIKKQNLRTDLQYWAASDSLYLLDEHLMNLLKPNKLPGGKTMDSILKQWNKIYNSIVK